MESDKSLSKELNCMGFQVLISSPSPVTTTGGSDDESPCSRRGWFIMAQVTLRSLVALFSLAAALILVTSGQTVTPFGIVMKASYTYSAALKFKLVADGLGCGCSLVSVVWVVYLSSRPPKLSSNPRNYFYLLLHDLVMVVVVISGCAAGTAIGFLAKYGQNQTGWMLICDRVAKFCNKVLLSIAFSYSAFACIFLLTLVAAYKLMSLPPPPPPPPPPSPIPSNL